MRTNGGSSGAFMMNNNNTTSNSNNNNNNNNKDFDEDDDDDDDFSNAYGFNARNTYIDPVISQPASKNAPGVSAAQQSVPFSSGNSMFNGIGAFSIGAQKYSQFDLDLPEDIN